jgi:uncharacterized tellurite resistance protein B-like protein
MEQSTTILGGHSDLEKGAYLTAIASLATADHQATEDEVEYISTLCDSADLSEEQKQYVLRAASESNGEELTHALDVLKSSELRFSLVADLMAFAKSDEDYSEAEQQNIQQIARYLGVNQEQFSTLNQFVDKASTTDADPQQIQQQGFFGMGDKMQSAGIGSSGLMKGLISFAAPMLLGSLLSRGLGGGRRRGGLGGALGGSIMGGGLGGMLGGGGGLGGMMGGGGGLGSLIGMLSGGRGMNRTGGLLGRMLGGRGF